jgi:hypothetical protein
MGHLRARDLLFDGMIDHSRVEELAYMRGFDMFCHRVCQVVRRTQTLDWQARTSRRTRVQQ